LDKDDFIPAGKEEMSMKRFTIEQLDTIINRGLIVSCQPVVNGALDRTDAVVAMGLACLAGGAKALRIEGAGRVRQVRESTAAPIIGIVKRDLPDSEIRITPTPEDIADLSRAGADIIAFDATDRTRPYSREALVGAIVEHECYGMADCSIIDDVEFSLGNGVEFIGTTLSGYTGGITPEEPDYAFLSNAVRIAPRVIAEGRYNTIEHSREAIRLGAWGVTVGTALTRLETMTGWFVEGLRDARTGDDRDAEFASGPARRMSGI